MCYRILWLIPELFVVAVGGVLVGEGEGVVVAEPLPASQRLGLPGRRRL